MAHTEYEFKSSDGLRLFGRSWSPEGEKRGLVLLVHGLGEHSGRYDHVGNMLADAGYVTSACDLRGHGKSEGRRGHSPSFDAFMNDMGLFIRENEKYFPEMPKFLYGHSLGALLTLNYAARRRSSFNGLVATGPALRNELEKQRAKVLMINLMNNILPTLTMPTGLDATQLSRNKTVVQAYLDDPLVHDRATVSMAKSSLKAIDWVFEHAADIHEPLLLMQASEDKICYPSSTDEFSQKVSGEVTIKFWDGFYHEIHNDPGWEEVIRFMIGWLNDHCH